jgi:small metal-binding protein
MKHGHCMKTVMGGLSLVLVLSACSSGSKSKTTTPPPSSDMSRSAPPSGDMSRSEDMKRGATPTISPPTDLPRSDVVTDRGTSRRTISDPSDRARLSDRSPEIAAACPSRADANGKVVFDDPTCPDRYRRQAGTTAESGAAGLAAACSSKSDANGKVVYDDPACPDRYRRQAGTTAESGAAGLAAACSSKSDANGKVIYDDPTCPDRYRRQAGAMSSIREARVRLSRAAGIKVWDTAAGAGTNDYAGVDPRCPSTVDAKGKVAYADAGCAERYRFQTKENAFYDRYADKAAKHARAAEIAGNEGNMPDMIEDAELSLDHAKEARRANNNPDLAAGIAALRQAIALGQTHEVPRSTSSTTSAAAAAPRTFKGELSQKKDATRADGGESYVLRDRENREMPITLSPEMSRQVQVGDVVEAQVDSNGQVTSITKAQ